MQTLINFFYRMVGPILIISAVSIFGLLYNSSTEYYTNVKKGAENKVYSQSSSVVSDESLISRDELIGILMVGPDKNLRISDKTGDSKIVVDIHTGRGIVSYVNVYKNSEEVPIDSYVFAKDEWDGTVLPVNDWLVSQNFRIHVITNSVGEIKRIRYEGE